MLFEGVFVATITPFTSGGEVDGEALGHHLQWLAQSGVSGFVPCATTGEGVALSTLERHRVIETTLSISRAHGLKTIVGCSSNVTKFALESILEAARLGADAALVVTPYYNRPTASGLLAHYLQLAESSPIPILLYNVPVRTGVHLPIEVTLKLFEHARIAGIKEASGQYSHWLALASQMNLQEKSLLAGDDDAFALIRALGGSGIISASANVAPHYFVQLESFAQKKAWGEAFEIQKKIFPLVRSLFLETSPAPIKYALNRRGIAPHLRLPLVPVGEATRSAIDKALSTLGTPVGVLEVGRS